MPERPWQRLSYSRRGCWQECKRKAFYRYWLRIARPSDMRPANFGKAFHKLLEAHHSGDDALEAFRSDFDPGVPADDLYTEAKAELMYRAYQAQYPLADIEMLETEKKLEGDLGNGTVYVGILDGIIKWTDFIYVIEYKTTKRTVTGLSANYIIKECNVADQITGNLWLAQTNGWPKCQGVLMDYLQVAKTKEAFLRTIEMRTPEWTAEWLQECRDIASEMREMDHMTKSAFTKNTQSCTKYGACEYLPLCTGEATQDEYEEKSKSPFDGA